MNKIFAGLLAISMMILSNSTFAAERSLTKNEEVKIISLIKAQLKLPANAKFNLGKMVNNTYDAYCGSVVKSNKDSIPFIVSMPEPIGSIDLRRIILIGDSEYNRKSVIEQCTEQGYSLN